MAPTYKIMFVPGVLPEEFPQARERKARQPLAQGRDRWRRRHPKPRKRLRGKAACRIAPAETMEALAQALVDSQAAGKHADALAEAVANGEAISTEIIGGDVAGQVLVIAAEPEDTEATAQLASDAPAKEPASKGKGKKGAATTDSTGK